MAEQLRQRGISDSRVLAALARIPRHRFLDSGLLGRSYDDTSLPIGQDQTIYVGTENGRLTAVQFDDVLASDAWPTFQHDLNHTGRSD